MIIDSLNQFGTNKPLITGSTGTQQLGDVIDTTTLSMRVGGPSLYLVIIMKVTAASGGLATAQFSLCSDDQAALNTISATYHFGTAAIPVATLVAGYQVTCFELPAGPYERYLGILQTTAGAAFTAGRVDMFLTSDPAAWRVYPDGL